MYYAQNISTGEFWYFTTIQNIADYLEASLDDVNMALERTQVQHRTAIGVNC